MTVMQKKLETKYNDRYFSSLSRSFELRFEWDENLKFLKQPKTMQQLNTNTAVKFINKKTNIHIRSLSPLDLAMVKVCQEYLKIVNKMKNDKIGV